MMAMRNQLSLLTSSQLEQQSDQQLEQPEASSYSSCEETEVDLSMMSTIPTITSTTIMNPDPESSSSIMIMDPQQQSNSSLLNYSMLSLSKSKPKPELYQLVFDIQNDLDEHDQHQFHHYNHLNKLEPDTPVVLDLKGQDPDPDKTPSKTSNSIVFKQPSAIIESSLPSTPSQTPTTTSPSKTILVTNDPKSGKNLNKIWMTASLTKQALTTGNLNQTTLMMFNTKINATDAPICCCNIM